MYIELRELGGDENTASSFDDVSCVACSAGFCASRCGNTTASTGSFSACVESSHFVPVSKAVVLVSTASGEFNELISGDGVDSADWEVLGTCACVVSTNHACCKLSSAVGRSLKTIVNV